MRNRALFLWSKGVSHIGTRLFTFALSWYILSETGSGLSFSLSLLVNYLPQIALSFFAGSLSARARRPGRMLAVCDVVSAAVCCLPLFFGGLWAVYATIFLLSAVSAVFNNAADTHMTCLEGVEDAASLKKLTSAGQFLTSAGNVAAPALGGALIRVAPVAVFAVINIVSFLLSAFGEIFLRYRPREAALRREASERSGREVLAYMFGRPSLRRFFLADSVGNFCFTAGFNVALPVIVTTVLGISSTGYGLISSSVAVGSMACALWRSRYPRSRVELRYPLGGLTVLGGGMLVLAAAARLGNNGSLLIAALCAVMLTVGWTSVEINIQVKTAMQLLIEPAYLGKVLGVSTSVSFLLIPLSLLAAGGVTETAPPWALPLAGGALMLATAVILRLRDGNAAAR